MIRAQLGVFLFRLIALLAETTSVQALGTLAVLTIPALAPMVARALDVLRGEDLVAGSRAPWFSVVATDLSQAGMGVGSAGDLDGAGKSVDRSSAGPF